MRRALVVSTLILVVLLSACKSKPAPVSPQTPYVPPAEAATPAVNTPDTTTASNDAAETTYAAAPNTASSAASASASNRHQSGIILDGASNYTVRRGDTMSGIARRLYRDGSLYPLIMMVSGVVTDPDKIRPGMRLTVPALTVNMNDPTAKAAINRYFLQIAQIEERRGRRRTAQMIRNHVR